MAGAFSGLDFSLNPLLFWSTLVAIFIAELPDKTAFATLLLATRGKPWAVFLGVAGAFVIQSLVAVLFGSVLALLPRSFVRYLAGGLFLVFAFFMWRRRDERTEAGDQMANASLWRTAASSFMVIFIAEWGDLTQLATATLEAKARSPITIFLAATLALWLVAGLAIYLGRHAKRHIEPRLLQRIAAVTFAAIGLLLLFGLFG